MCGALFFSLSFIHGCSLCVLCAVCVVCVAAVLVRVDYNVPLKNGKVMDTRRIEETIDTLKLLLGKKGSVFVCFSVLAAFLLLCCFAAVLLLFVLCCFAAVFVLFCCCFPPCFLSLCGNLVCGVWCVQVPREEQSASC